MNIVWLSILGCQDTEKKIPQTKEIVVSKTQTQTQTLTPKLISHLVLSASNPSKLFLFVGPQCLQSIKTIPYHWTSMPPSRLFHIIGPQCPQSIKTMPYYWISMPPIHQDYSPRLDLNASNTSGPFPIIGPQCLQALRTIPCYWMQNMSIMILVGATAC